MDQSVYHCLLHLFRSSAWNKDCLLLKWTKFVLAEGMAHEMNGRIVLVADHTKQPKDARKIPEVTTMRKDSETSSRRPSKNAEPQHSSNPEITSSTLSTIENFVAATVVAHGILQYISLSMPEANHKGQPVLDENATAEYPIGIRHKTCCESVYQRIIEVIRKKLDSVFNSRQTRQNI